MTELRALVQAFLDADDDLVATEKAITHAQTLAMVKWARERVVDSRQARDDAYQAMRAAVREGK